MRRPRQVAGRRSTVRTRDTANRATKASSGSTNTALVHQRNRPIRPRSQWTWRATTAQASAGATGAVPEPAIHRCRPRRRPPRRRSTPPPTRPPRRPRPVRHRRRRPPGSWSSPRRAGGRHRGTCGTARSRPRPGTAPAALRRDRRGPDGGPRPPLPARRVPAGPLVVGRLVSRHGPNAAGRRGGAMRRRPAAHHRHQVGEGRCLLVGALGDVVRLDRQQPVRPGRHERSSRARRPTATCRRRGTGGGRRWPRRRRRGRPTTCRANRRAAAARRRRSPRTAPRPLRCRRTSGRRPRSPREVGFRGPPTTPAAWAACSPRRAPG